MARKPMTEAQKKARVAKAKATRERKKQEALATLGLSTERKKVRRTRKMTEEQKQAARDRLAKARANRGPSRNKMIAENVRLLPDDNPLSLQNVKSWIKENKDLLSAIKSFRESKDWKDRDRYNQVATYVANLEAYLRDGVYRDNRWGSEMQGKIRSKVVCMAYHKDGTPKRTVGFVYPDVGLYTQEMAEEDGR